MRKDILVKIEIAVVLIVLVILAVFGEDLAEVFSEMTQAESMIDQLLR